LGLEVASDVGVDGQRGVELDHPFDRLELGLYLFGRAAARHELAVHEGEVQRIGPDVPARMDPQPSVDGAHLEPVLDVGQVDATCEQLQEIRGLFAFEPFDQRGITEELAGLGLREQVVVELGDDAVRDLHREGSKPLEPPQVVGIDPEERQPRGKRGLVDPEVFGVRSAGIQGSSTNRAVK
jgi:hypothetical protein